MPEGALPSCEGCQHLDDIDKVRRNNQYDIIYCTQCEDSFERRMKAWHCPFSPLVKKEVKNETV